MLLAATHWLPPKITIALGSGAFFVLVLSVAAMALRVAKEKTMLAGGFFCTGLFLIVVGYPCFDPVSSLFEPVERIAYPHTQVPGDLVFGFLALVCLLRAGYLWTSDQNRLQKTPD